VSDLSKYDFESDFDKEKVVKLANDIGCWLNGQGIGAVMWKIQPWAVVFKVATARDDISEIICNVYLRKEVMHVELSVEPNTRILLLSVFLQERWFVEEKKNVQNRKQHPEAEGGTLA